MLDKFRNLFFKTIHITDQKSGPGLDAKTLTSYNVSRQKLNTDYICHAPFSNMYFNVHGDCAPCWLTFIEPDSYTQKSIRDIWFGEKYQSLRKHLLDFDLTHKCSTCLKNLQGGNYTSVLARAYDVNPIQEYPAMMELEIANTCNLECVMCIGELSSAIRKNREKLPPIKNPYDDKFIEQLEEFIPHLKELRFNGGEPFLINSVFKIFEKVEKLNPKLKIVIATNGTVWNYKVREWLDKLNIHINFSLDSLTPEIYEAIRVNAHFDRVMEHFLHFRKYCLDNKRTMCLMVNPMRNNWHEMPDFIRFVNKHNINIWFNTIQRPEEWSIWALPENDLKNVFTTLTNAEFSKEDRQAPLAAYNIAIYKNLANVQIKNWYQEAMARGTEEANEQPEQLPDNHDARKIIEKNLYEYIGKQSGGNVEQVSARLKMLMDKIDKLQDTLCQRNGNIEFYLAVYKTPADVLYTSLEGKSMNSLVDEFEMHFLQSVKH